MTIPAKETNQGSSKYDPNSVTQHFDEYGRLEWDRLVQSPMHEVSLYVHTHYLEKYVVPGNKVLEIGAGPGRFTQVLAGLGAQIVIADISSVQLELNRRFAAELGFDHAILDRQQVDICDLSQFASDSFDCVVVYGGPFSYVLDRRDLALSECLRVLSPGGVLLLSVMSLWGTIHGFLDGVLATPVPVNQKIIHTGDITPATYPERKGNFMHLFRVDELRTWLEKFLLELVDLSASNCLSLAWNEVLKEIKNDREKWDELLRMELEACADPGCLNMGTHLIAVAKKSQMEKEK
jgi:SAM-dependent methyltransferase